MSNVQRLVPINILVPLWTPPHILLLSDVRPSSEFLLLSPLQPSEKSRRHKDSINVNQPHFHRCGVWEGLSFWTFEPWTSWLFSHEVGNRFPLSWLISMCGYETFEIRAEFTRGLYRRLFYSFFSPFPCIPANQTLMCISSGDFFLS